MPASSRLCVATVLLLLSVTPAARAEWDGGFSYIPGTPNGPENWGNLKPEWATCSTGKRQSPINLDSLQLTLAPGLGYLNYTYQNAKASVVNHGNEIKVRFDGDAGSLVINSTAYHLRQMHWHTPSEHTIDDRRYDMELHMVHLNAQNETAVIGILYDVGIQRDEFLYKLEPYIRKIVNQKDKEVLVYGGVDPNIAKGLDNIYYRFMGSFTTPPCIEGVTWTIIKEVRTVSFTQLALLRAAVLDGFENNARPVQDVNKREIELFFPLPLSIEHDVPIRDASA